MAERHVRAVQKYSNIESDTTRHVLEVIALDIGRDDSPAHTSQRKIASRARLAVNTVRDAIEEALAADELILRKEGKFHLYSLNPEKLPYGRTPKRENSGKFGADQRPATLRDLQRMEEKLSQHYQELYQKLYHDIVSIVSRSLQGGDTEGIEKDTKNAREGVDGNKELINHFQNETGLMPSGESFNQDWLPVLDGWRESYGVEGAKKRITAAVQFARGDNKRGQRYVITSPRSLVNITANLPDGSGSGGSIKVGAR